MAHFYTYQNPNPSALNSSDSGHWENPADWPRTFLYVSAHQDTQGIHPPAPVYQSSPSSSQPAIYYFAVSRLSISHFIVKSLIIHSREVPLLQLATMSTASTMDRILLLPQLVGPTPPLHIPATPCLPLLLLRTLHTPTRTTAHHTIL